MAWSRSIARSRLAFLALWAVLIVANPAVVCWGDISHGAPSDSLNGGAGFTTGIAAGGAVALALRRDAACADGVDNDGDGWVDQGEDLDCESATDDTENPPAVHSFSYDDGASPHAGLALGSDGALYGTTFYGGASGAGTVFRIDAAGSFASLHSFSASEDEPYPNAVLVLGSDGALYGTTLSGGASGAGTLFRIDAAGSFASLHSFSASGDGSHPDAALVLGSDGALYGTTAYGGASGGGTLFRIDAAGSFASLHSFAGEDGYYPYAPLALGSDGALYGTTLYGGTSGAGTVFRIDRAGSFASLHSFTYEDGFYPNAGLVLGSDGALYGTTSSGGVLGAGALFQIDPAGAFALLRWFRGDDGAYPATALVLGSDGALYGTTQSGGSGFGVVYRFAKATPTLTWPAPDPIALGTPIDDAQLAATASVPGRFAYTPPAGTVLGVGAGQRLEVRFTPTDAVHYGPASASVTIDVRYAFVGFLGAVLDPPTQNPVRAGQVVPIRFALGGDQGLDILAEGSPRAQRVSCDDLAPIGESEAASSPGTAALRYAPGIGRYSYRWKTDPSWAGSCREFTLELIDGTLHRALFRFPSSQGSPSSGNSERLRIRVAR